MNKENVLNPNADAADNAAESPDFIRTQRLKRMKSIALGFFLAALALYLIGLNWQHSHPAFSYLKAFAEAAMIGAVADWFAVVALFRHPLGLPIWHTAIIPRSKEQIGRSLANFIVSHLVTTSALTARLQALNPAEKLSGWLLASRIQSARWLTQLGAVLLNQMDDTKLQQLLAERIRQKLTEVDLSGLATQIIQGLVEDGKHQKLLDAILNGINDKLDQDENRALLVAWINDALDVDNIEFMGIKIGSTVRSLTEAGVTRIISGLQKKSLEVINTQDHVWRGQFNEYTQVFLDHLESDPAWQNKIAQARNSLLASPAMADWGNRLWNEAKTQILTDMASEQSAIQHWLEQLIVSYANRLKTDSATQTSVNQFVLEIVPPLVENNKTTIASFIQAEIDSWSAEEVSERIELAIGYDLQFIRINGTLVGGLVGLLIHALTLAFTS